MATATGTEAALAVRGAMAPLPYRVLRNRRENAGTFTLDLEPVGESIPPIRPGQFTMLYAFGVGEVPISTSGDTENGGPLVHTIRAAGAVTRALCASRRDDVIGVRGPFGNTWPIEEAHGKDLVIVTGGIGLPPLRPVIYHALAHREQFGNVVILYGGRSPAELLYRTELEKWRSRLDVTLDVTVDTAGAEWRGRVGVVTKLIPRAPFDADDAVAMIVGPEIMMKFAAAGLIDRGMEPESIYVSMERTMRCGIGLCGHCQLGPTLICRDGPVYRWDELAPLLEVEEL